MNSKVALARCDDYDPLKVQAAVRRAVDLAGGIAGFIKPGSRVLVKPNLLMAKEPEFGITTHPEVVRAAVKLLKEINCSVMIGDGPSVWGGIAEKVDEVYTATGMRRIAEEEKVTLVKFQNWRWRKDFSLTNWLDDCDYIVSIPKFKTHGLTTLSGAVKNLYGLVSVNHKTELHRKYFKPEEFSRILVDIYQEARPALTIIDGVIAMEGNGPGTSGTLREAGLIAAGSDCAALDGALSLVMGLEPEAVGTNKEAAKRGLGVIDKEKIDFVGDPLAAFIREPFKLPGNSILNKIPGPVVKIIKHYLRFYPCVGHNVCTKCLTCVKACPNQAVSFKKGRIEIDRSKCISCFCCQESCPVNAISAKKSLLAKLIGL